jgi:hypothetical protein
MIQGRGLHIAQSKAEQQSSHGVLAGGDGEKRLNFRRPGRCAERHDQRPAGEQKEELLWSLKDAERKETKLMARLFRRGRVRPYGPLELSQPSLAFGHSRHSRVVWRRRGSRRWTGVGPQARRLRGVGGGRIRPSGCSSRALAVAPSSSAAAFW